MRVWPTIRLTGRIERYLTADDANFGIKLVEPISVPRSPFVLPFRQRYTKGPYSALPYLPKWCIEATSCSTWRRGPLKCNAYGWSEYSSPPFRFPELSQPI